MKDSDTEIFDRHKPRLFGLAYRMLGSYADAEDVVQDAYIRWHERDDSELRSAEAWLVTVTTRIALDRLKKASSRRETYIGPWLPEPIFVSASPEEHAERASDLSIAFLLLLERLAPVERAAFLLHDVFDCDYATIAAIVGKSEPATRQIVSRARGRLREPATRFRADDAEKLRLLRQFKLASQTGDSEALASIFSRDAVLYSDGGGKVTAARKPVRGRRRLARMFGVAGPKFEAGVRDVYCYVNGEPAMLAYVGEELVGVTTVAAADGEITVLFRILNPDKLARIAAEAGSL